MGCASCATGPNGTPSGCGKKGLCLTGSCNKLNTYDWLANLDIEDVDPFTIVEVSFKNGARKGFFHCAPYLGVVTGDYVAVESRNGYNIGQISLSGELVRMQMKKKKTNEDHVLLKVIRKANGRDIERMSEARSKEKPALVRARSIARTMGLEMKIGDVEYQADQRKATFYYTADGRIDFRELVRVYAREFNMKIEMRQIGARQESARVGGMGSCGRELCCSTWLTDFKSVTTSAARYQNLAINQSKLSGQCGRLKCCLNYELDTYMEVLEEFPMDATKLKTKEGTAELVKTDIFKRRMYYSVRMQNGLRNQIVVLSVERASEIFEANKKGKFPDEFMGQLELNQVEEEEIDFADVTGQIELREEKKPRKKKKRPSKNRNKRPNKNRRSNDNKNSK